MIVGERVAELTVSARHAKGLLARGGVEYGFGHFPVMIALHVALACLDHLHSLATAEGITVAPEI